MTPCSIFVAMHLEKSIHNMNRSQLLVKMKGQILSHKNTFCSKRTTNITVRYSMEQTLVNTLLRSEGVGDDL